MTPQTWTGTRWAVLNPNGTLATHGDRASPRLFTSKTDAREFARLIRHKDAIAKVRITIEPIEEATNAKRSG